MPLPPKPRSRSQAETRDDNLERYKLGTFGIGTTAALGVKVLYPQDKQGATASSFETDSAAKSAGILQNDKLLEVDGAAVGFLRNRHYELWAHYGRSGDNTTEVLVSYLAASGERLYYYLPVSTSPTGGDVRYFKLPDDYWTVPKPTTRSSAESEQKNVARYVLGEGNFDEYSQWELGTEYLQYSYEYGAVVMSIKAGFPAANELKVGDAILEVDGAPLGVFGGRVYEIWRQYVYSKYGKVELLIRFIDPMTNQPKYYYPEMQLVDRSTQA